MIIVSTYNTSMRSIILCLSTYVKNQPRNKQPTRLITKPSYVGSNSPRAYRDKVPKNPPIITNNYLIVINIIYLYTIIFYFDINTNHLLFLIIVDIYDT